jgi:hypothetical protein
MTSLSASAEAPACRRSLYSNVTFPLRQHLNVVRRVFPTMFAPAILLAGQNFKVDDVKVVGYLEYGQTSAPVECSGAPSYCAFVFNGQGDDRIEVDVSEGEGKAFVAIADGALDELTSGTNRVVVSLPRRGPDSETYYIVFRDRENKPGRFMVKLKILAK